MGRSQALFVQPLLQAAHIALLAATLARKALQWWLIFAALSAALSPTYFSSIASTIHYIRRPVGVLEKTIAAKRVGGFNRF